MSEDTEKPRHSVLSDLAGIWPVTHLPSGALYHCPTCGSAVFNVAAHRLWHLELEKHIENAAFGIVDPT